MASLLSGCAAVQPPPPAPVELFSDLKTPFTLQFSHTSTRPELINNIVIRGKGQGTAVGALQGVGFCFEMASGDSSGFGLILAILCTPVGAVVGGVAGAVTTEGADEIEQNERALIEAHMLDGIQARLHQNLTEYANRLGLPLSNAGSGNQSVVVLRTTLASIEVQGSGKTGMPLRFVFTGQAELFADSGYQPMVTHSIVYRTRIRTFEQWAGDNFSLMEAEFQQALQYMAEESLNRLVLLYHPPQLETEVQVAAANPDPASSTTSLTLNAPQVKQDDPDHPRKHYLQPLYPEVTFGLNLMGAYFREYRGGSGMTTFNEVEESSPLFRWQALPSSYASVWSQLEQVRYELRIYKAEYDPSAQVYLPSLLLYAVEDLAEPEHRLPALDSLCGRLYWSVRMRFWLDGMPRVSEWSGTYSRYVPPWKLREMENRAEIMHIAWSMPRDNFFPVRMADCPEPVVTARPHNQLLPELR